MTRTLRRTIILEGGAEAEMLFTPHLYSYRGFMGASLEYKEEDNLSLYDTYKDIMFLAAVNAWELDGRGTSEDFPYRRGDFHEWAALNPKEFGAATVQAITGLTGKTVEELTSASKKKEAEKENRKPSESGATGRKSKPSWWGNAVLRFIRPRSLRTESTC